MFNLPDAREEWDAMLRRLHKGDVTVLESLRPLFWRITETEDFDGAEGYRRLRHLAEYGETEAAIVLAVDFLGFKPHTAT